MPWPLIFFFGLSAGTFFISLHFPSIANIATSFLISENGEAIAPRILTGVISALFIASYITERYRGREEPLMKHLFNFFTTLSLSVGFYTLSRWLLLDIYGDQPEKFMPFMGKLDISAFIVALIMLLAEVSKQLAHELNKLMPTKLTGEKVTPAPPPHSPGNV